MAWLRVVLARIRAVFSRDQLDVEFEQEVQLHLDL